MAQANNNGGIGGLWALAGTALAGLAAGAAASHMAGRRSRRIAREALAPPPPPKTPQDFDAEEPGRGRAADRPEHIPRKGWTDILWRLGASYFGDRVGFLSGGVTFFVALSLFPTLGALVSVYGLFADPAQAAERLELLYSVLPPGVAGFLAEEMQRLAENSNTELTFTLVWTLLLSLWTANSAVKMLFFSLNVAYHEVERRHPVRFNLICMAFTLSGFLAVQLSAALVVGVPLVLGVFGLAEEWNHLTPLRWPILLVIYVAALALAYRIGPSRARARWRWVVPGAVFAGLLSLGLSFGFSWYVQTFVRTASYGPLAAMMGFLLWTWLTVQIVIMGAELNAEIEHQTAVDTTTGAPRPLGDRGAVVADSVGPRRGNPAALAYTLRYAELLSDRLLRRRSRREASRD